MKKELQVQKITFYLLLIGLLLAFFLPPTDPDLGWQLRCGQQIWQERKICDRNEFSVMLENYRWPHSNSLYQFLLFPFYWATGFFGLSLANSLLVTVSLIILFSLEGNREIKIILLPFALCLSWTVFLFGIRGQEISIFYFLLLLKIIDLGKKKNSKLWLLAIPLTWFWANSHGGFVIGLLVLFICLAEKIIFVIFNQEKLKNCLPITATCFSSLGVTFLNPFGWKIYWEAWRHFRVVPLNTLIAEWVPPLALTRTIIFLTGAAIIILAVFYSRKTKLPMAKILILLALAILALKARRNLAFYFIFWVYFFSTLKINFQKLKQIILPVSFLSSLAIFSFGLFVQLPKTILADSNWSRFCNTGPVIYPCQAVKFLKKQKAGYIFDRYEWGGFLVWQLPEYKVFVDGRMPAWPTPSGKSPYTLYLETLWTWGDWQKTLANYDWILISPGEILDLTLSPKPEKLGWNEVYRDKIAVIYQKI